MSNCHGPSCNREALVEFFCSENCQARWHGQLDSPPLPAGWYRGRLAPFGGLDLTPFREALERAARSIAAVAEISPDLLTHLGGFSQDAVPTRERTDP